MSTQPTLFLWRYWYASELFRFSTVLPSTVLSSYVSTINRCGIDTLSLVKWVGEWSHFACIFTATTLTRRRKQTKPECGNKPELARKLVYKILRSYFKKKAPAGLEVSWAWMVALSYYADRLPFASHHLTLHRALNCCNGGPLHFRRSKLDSLLAAREVLLAVIMSLIQPKARSHSLVDTAMVWTGLNY